eukprot:CAMPEP_0175128570 /NCGR_PEP_ID=MMETSP0087-20121206/5000_1 /TAXON_ID=136419 /ORGANISM="Unknown Unknown, Strain D1" /LENGTH=67 /DNA_ID=CAMNT_0016410643 /DNA_START=1082 /DNA_END=1286 /DNA_ORIENTATION=-
MGFAPLIVIFGPPLGDNSFAKLTTGLSGAGGAWAFQQSVPKWVFQLAALLAAVLVLQLAVGSDVGLA